MDRSPRSYTFGAFRLDVAEHRLLRADEPVPITPKLFELLRVLVERAGHLVEKNVLIEEVWPGTFVDEANLSRGISVLRKTLGETSGERYIETVPKRGYRFVAAVRPDSGEPPGSQTAPRTGEEVRWRPRRVGIALAIALAVGAIAISLGVLGRLGRDQGQAAVAAPIHHQLTFTGKETTPTLSPDGTHIAYVSTAGPRRKVMVQALAGGAPLELFAAEDTGGLRWSPDGSELLVRALGDRLDGLHLVSRATGTARKIFDANLVVACWSPDGSLIAIASFSSRKVIFVDRRGQVRGTIALHGIRDWIWDIDWSPIDDRLLFVADDDERRGTVWTIRRDGTAQTKVLTSAVEILAARWAASGDAVYYFGRVNQTVSLYKASLDTARAASDAQAVPLLSGLETDEGFGLSADRRRLVYARAPYYSNLWLVERIDEGNGRYRVQKTPLTNGTSVVERPRISPDGQRILFSMGYESRTNLYTIPVTGGMPKQLTSLNAFSIGGVWSPDGRTVAFASNEGGKTGIWLVDADGRSPRAVGTGELSESYELAWAPGTQLLYQQTDNRNFYVLEPRTSAQRMLIADGSVGWAAFPVYSPDGTQIAFRWNRHPGRGIWLIDSKDWSQKLLFEAPASSDPLPYPIAWAADARAIYAWNGRRAAYRGISVPYELTLTAATITKLHVAGGELEPILSLPFEEVGSVAAFPDGRRFVASVYSSRSDIWAVDDFDVPASSGVARRRRFPR